MNNMKELIKKAKYELDPEGAKFDEASEANNHLASIDDKLSKPLKVETPEKVENVADFVSTFIKSITPKHEWDGTAVGFDGGEKVDLKGDTGEKGDKGDDGETPVKGEDYFTAEEIDKFVEHIIGELEPKIEELRPQKGIDYFDGENGVDGIDGIDGKDGKDAITPEQKEIDVEIIIKEVIARLKNIKGNDRLDISHIRNAHQLAGKNMSSKKLDMSDQRWHGGGITQTGFAGLPEDLTSQVNGVAQVFTTAGSLNSIIWVTLNGQMIHEGVDFSKTNTNQITFLLYTPAGVDQIFIKYV